MTPPVHQGSFTSVNTEAVTALASRRLFTGAATSLRHRTQGFDIQSLQESGNQKSSGSAADMSQAGWQTHATNDVGLANACANHTRGVPATHGQRQIGETTRVNMRNPIMGLEAADELILKVSNLPLSWTTKNCFDLFNRYGNVTNIFIFQDKDGRSRGECKVTFRPHPRERFWSKPIQVISDGNGPRKQPLRFQVLPPDEYSRRRNAERVQVDAKRVSIGVMQGHDMLEMFESEEVAPARVRSPGHHQAPITLVTNPEYHEFSINFPVHFVHNHAKSPLNRTDVIRLTFTLRQRLQILHAIDPEDHDCVILAFNSEIVPKCSRRGEEIRFFKDHPYTWNEHNSYYRQTDVVVDPHAESYRKRPASLRRDESVISLGRWPGYALKINVKSQGRKQEAPLRRLLNVFRDYNVDVQVESDIRLIPGHGTPAVWDLLNPPVDENATTLETMMDAYPLTFAVRYQLEVCISGGWLNEYDLSPEWVQQLRRLPPKEACALLEQVAVDRPEEKSRRIRAPFSIFEKYKRGQSVLAQKIPSGKLIIRSATVTPTTILVHTPSLEISNRVIRHYQKHFDRFLRIRFLDERTMGRIYGRSDKSSEDEVYTRIKRILVNGLNIGERHYDLLAWGNSQFRENGAYFFCNDDSLNADDIRQWMGDFSDIKVVAKYAARIGQCFSTTRAVTGGTPKLFDIPDVVRGKYNFTDGIGKISTLYAGMAGQNFKFVAKAEEVPSAYQFRLGGSKGVLAVWPDIKGMKVCLRPSQNKFKALKAELEIIRHSQTTEFSLNRQIILVLSALGVRHDVFLKKASQQLARIHKAMEDPETAIDALRCSVDANHMTPQIADMVSAGFQANQEPFVKSLLLLWRAWSIKYLKEKARIHIKDGVVVIGVTDESQVLRGHYEKDQHKLKYHDTNVRLQAIPEVFLQVSNYQGTGQTKVLTELMIIARNPSLHAGDIRVVKGVDRKELRHLKDVVVLPQTGDRDLASMCSGGDLDGDDYLVCWDPELIPPEWNVPALAFDPPDSVKTKGNVTLDDLTSFYVRYMKNTELGQIAHTHLATADVSPDGVKSQKCIRLAELHSNAVDYPKTGVPAIIPDNLRVKKWPHFMEKKNSYKSTSALGKLYDSVHRETFEPPYNNPFDKRILDAYPTTSEQEAAAVEIKKNYDAALRRLMQQHGIKTEFEVWSTFVMEYNGTMGDYKFAEELGHDVSAIKEQYVEICLDKAGGRQYELLAPFVIAMYKVTQAELNVALYECENIRLDQDGNMMEMKDKSPTSMPYMSFPWLFSHTMCKIAKEYQALREGRPVGNVQVFNFDEIGTISAALGNTSLQNKPSPEAQQTHLHSDMLIDHVDELSDVTSVVDGKNQQTPSTNGSAQTTEANSTNTTKQAEIPSSDEDEDFEDFAMEMSGPSAVDKLGSMFQ